MPNSLTLNGSGTTGSTTISETNYMGTFGILSNSCTSGGTAQAGQTPNGPIAGLSPSGSYSNPTNITVTANEAGKCTVVFEDSKSQTVTLSIDVTTTTVVIDKRGTKTNPSPTPRAGSAPVLRSGNR